MKTAIKTCLMIALAGIILSAAAHPKAPYTGFRVLALSEDGGHHLAYTIAAKQWLARLAAKNNFTVDYIKNTSAITDSLLANYQLFLQLDYVPYGWSDTAKAAFKKYIEEGKGGWIGFHHAGLLGDFDGYSMWQWFSDFMGGIKYENYIASFAKATVKVEDKTHPVMKDVPSSFAVEQEEWYTFNKSPRPNVHVIATVDENTYVPGSKIKMGGDHPVIWTNEQVKARNIYIFMGHSPLLFTNKAYTTLFANAILWASQKAEN